MKRYILLLLAVCLFLCGCSFEEPTEYIFPEEEIPTEASTEEVTKGKGKVVIVSDGNEETSFASGAEVKVGKNGIRVENETEQLPGEPYFTSGVWMVSVRDNTTKYCIFEEDDAKGYFIDLESGEKSAFTCKRGINTLTFKFENEDEEVEGRIGYWLKGKCAITWPDSPFELLTLLPDINPDGFKVYDDETLKKAVLDYYHKNYNKNAREVRLTNLPDGKARVEVYDKTLSTNLIYCDATVDRLSGKGDIAVAGEEFGIDLVSEGFLK